MIECIAGIDLQVETHADLFRLLKTWRPDAICFSGNYLANVPEIVDLAKAAIAEVFANLQKADFSKAK